MIILQLGFVFRTNVIVIEPDLWLPAECRHPMLRRRTTSTDKSRSDRRSNFPPPFHPLFTFFQQNHFFLDFCSSFRVLLSTKCCFVERMNEEKSQVLSHFVDKNNLSKKAFYYEFRKDCQRKEKFLPKKFKIGKIQI